ncbi:protein O-mannosyl-transferase TMTC1-like [Saccostrea echinata]|uniref:protein O-mannosyl-transferase TMTC1-like n=1 Tax=Saccostrea echinata TaxID=191078 RepID=UPI002A803C79|nr:protein O-mannosyl-transferase TMTC1-like [Saccostrea echinata]
MADNGKYIKIPEKYVICILAASAAFVCYLNSLNGDFVHDDLFAIKNNGDVNGRNPLWSLWENDFWGRPMADPRSHKSYRPFTVLSFRINFHLGQGSPYGFHVVNVCLHTLMTILFTYVCQTTLRLPAQCGLISGLIFAVHPIHTEAVSGIVGRADVMASIFFMLSFIAYVRSVEPGWPWFRHAPATRHWVLVILSVSMATVSMLCKEQGIMVLPVCILYDAVVCSRILLNYRSWYKMKPFLLRFIFVSIVGLTLLSFRFWIMRGQLPKFLPQDNPASFSSSFFIRVFTYGFVWFFNVWLLLFPSQLCYDWQIGSIPLVESLMDARNLATVLLAIVLFLLLLKSWREAKSEDSDVAVVPGLLFYTLPIIPASNLLFPVGFVVAERVLYLPSVGFCILVGYGAHLLFERFSHMKKIIFALVVYCLVVMAAKTISQNQVWRTRETLFVSGVRTLPHNAKIHYNYANYLKDTGQLNTAKIHYETAIRLYQDLPSAHNNLGTLLNDTMAAEFHYEAALRINPDHRGALINLGSSLIKRGKRHRGQELIDRVLDLDPENVEAIIVKAWVSMEEGNWTVAGQFFQRALERDPMNSEALYYYGKYWHQRGDLERAVKLYRKAFLTDSRQWLAMVSAGDALKQLGKYHEAEEILSRSLMISRSIQAMDSLGLLYFRLGRVSDSINMYKEIQTLDPDNAQSLLHFAQILGNMGESERAEEVLTEILQKNPQNPDAMVQMSNVLGQQNKHNQALNYLRDAIKITQRENNRNKLEILLFQQASHYKDLKRYDEALQSYNETIKINPMKKEAHLNIGAIFHLQRHYTKAKYHYGIVLKQDPENRLAKENLAKLINIEKKQTQT